MNEPTDHQPILICSAGTEATEHIVAAAAGLWPGYRAMVLRVWRSSQYTIAASSAAIAGTGVIDYAALDRAIEQDAREDAAQSAEHARSLGLDAVGEAAQAEGLIWQTILDEAKSSAAPRHAANRRRAPTRRGLEPAADEGVDSGAHGRGR
jgi:hypothetical protein